MSTTLATLAEHRRAGRKITMVTAYDYASARTIDALGPDSVDIILVGDSLGMVVLGYDTTLQVTMDDMVHHSAAVARGCTHPMVLTDLPFLSYVTPVDAVRNAGRLIQQGSAHAVKIEGGARVLPQVRALVDAQIPVFGHLGLTPQSVHALSGFHVQGRSDNAARQLLDDARALQEAGASALVLECVPAALAQKVTEALEIPTIGIGAGLHTDGQVLVWHDLLGLHSDVSPRFVRRFGAAEATITTALTDYCTAVREGTFPAPEHTY